MSSNKNEDRIRNDDMAVEPNKFNMVMEIFLGSTRQNQKDESKAQFVKMISNRDK